MSPTGLKLLVVILLSALPAHSVLANCQGQTQLEMNQCAAEKADEATKAMKIAYNNLYADLESEDRLELYKSQVAWIQYMRSWCNVFTSSSKGGSIRPMEIVMCRETLTRDREKELRSF